MALQIKKMTPLFRALKTLRPTPIGMIPLVVIACLMTGPQVFAEKHRHEHAHKHGAARLNIAFDNLEGKIEFIAAAEGILGFEYIPKTEAENKKLEKTIEYFEKNIQKMIQFNSSLSCGFQKEELAQVSEKQDNHDEHKGHMKHKESEKTHKGEHSDFVARFKVLCEKSPLGTALTLDFTHFSKLKDIDVVILLQDIQKSVELKSKALTINLK